MTKFQLEPRTAALRWSLLASLGLLPMACGGAFQGSDGGGESGSGGGGSGSKGGSTAKAGSTAKGGDKATGGTGNTAGTTSRAGSGTGGGTFDPRPCTSPGVDPLTGLVTCEEGFTHRPQPTVCGATATDAAPAEGGAANIGAPIPYQPRADGTVPCADDPTKCNVYQWGYCDNRGEIAAPTCASGCLADQDCGTDAICICGHDESPTGGVCVFAQCVSDLNCPDGYCANYSQVCGGGGFACQNSADECTSNQDCLGGSCTFDSSVGHRVCNGAVCGRPFLVEAAARVAPVLSGGAWRSDSGLQPSLDHLTCQERTTLAQHWTRMGQMEHASIAAFARFSLQLLSLGAPPELVEACTAALADETAHTKLCFDIASAYAGHAIGPGPLDIDGSLAVSSLEAIVDLVIAEGCFGETSAALEALEAAETASDAVIRTAYARIAEDEQRHAELAFRFVRWALERDPTTVAARLLAARDSPLAAKSTARAVVLPCFEALLALPSITPALECPNDPIQA